MWILSKENSETVLNYCKVLALVVAGVWTVYQWNKTIFPKENHESLLRLTETRVNLGISSVQFLVGNLTAPNEDSAPTTEAAGSDLYYHRAGGFVGQNSTETSKAEFAVFDRLISEVGFTIENSSRFPVQLHIADSKIMLHPITEYDALQPVGSIPVSVSEFFGDEVAEPKLIEPGSGAYFAGFGVFDVTECCADIPEEVWLAVFDTEIVTRSVHPETLEVVPDSETTKHVKFRRFFKRSESYFQSNGLIQVNASPQLSGEGPFFQMIGDQELKVYRGELLGERGG